MWNRIWTPAASRLSTRLLLSFIALILITAVVAGIPAYWLIRAELERQAWRRVADAQRVTTALIDREKRLVENLVTLAAQRPTLRRLLEINDQRGLEGYLQVLQAGVELDLLSVRDPSGESLAGSDLSSIEPDLSLEAEAALYCFCGPTDQVVLLATQPVVKEESGQILGYVTAGFLLDNDYARQLAEETGLEQIILLDGEAVATSLEARNIAPLSQEIREEESGKLEPLDVTLGQTRYYTLLLPLSASDGKPLAILASALSVTEVVAAEDRTAILLAITTLLVAAVGSGFAILLARRLTAPLAELTRAALNISQGDLTTPVPIPSEPAEITTLATALEASRASVYRTLDDLAQAKAWSESLIQSINEGVVTFDTRGMITFFSRGAERIMRCPSRKAVGRAMDHIFQLPDQVNGVFTDYIPPRGGKQQIDVLTHDGRPVTLAVTGASLIPPNSDTVQVALVLRDVTEEEASRHLRSYFLANITHEFRTPLTALNASIELLLEEAEHLTTAEMRELLGSIHLSVVGLRTLIDNLLESTSIEAGRFIIRRRPVELNRVMAQAIQVVQPLLDRRQQSLTVAEPTDLPTLSADPARLSQVVVNLLSNASKYSPPGTTIDLSIESSGEWLRVSIADRGPGIPETERADLFRRFVRLNTPGEEQYGIGLGLAVSKTIVVSHGGQIGVDGRPGGGSVFWFTLPIKETETA